MQMSEHLMVFQTLSHVIGSINTLCCTKFLQKVVYDSITQLNINWKTAYCLLVIYLETIEQSRGLLNVENVFESGAQDTRMRAALRRQEAVFGKCVPCDDEEDDKKVKWNGKDTPSARTCCIAFNIKNGTHVAKHMSKDGTCNHAHKCNHRITGKGPNGLCWGDHPSYECDNPNKTKAKERE